MSASIASGGLSPAIAAGALADALDLHGEGIRTLSLDCFDTLLWRATNAPTDVFAALRPEPGLRSRMHGEALARQLKRVTAWRTEVDLREIYRHLKRSADTEPIERAVQAELAAEARHCFAFAPTVALMRAAKARGLRLVIVSDTYLHEPELRALIAAAAGDDVAALIDRIFCSCEHGVSKGDGLFKHVLKALGEPPATILHIGDNPNADFRSATPLGIRAVHLEQFPDPIVQQLRLEAAAATVVDPGVRSKRPLLQIHRAPLALGWADCADAGERTGYGCVGPIVHGFVRWVIGEAQALRAAGARVRPLFLLRDAHLPHRVWELQPEAGEFDAARVELSRFSAFASSFHDERAVLEYVAEFGNTGRFDALTNQLMFTRNEAIQISDRIRRSDKRLEAFVAEIRKPHMLRKIIDRSSAYADRLIRYLREHAGIAEGDTLMLVDLGYAGTVQDRLAPVLRSRMKVEVVGRYLALRDVPGWQADKAGLIGPDRYDHRALDALCAYIAVIEQLCTIEQASVIDYGEDAQPIRKSTDMKARQSSVRLAAQDGCIRYVEAFAQAYHRQPVVLDAEAHRQTAAGTLARLLFLPSEDEIELFAGFEHDVNMGVDDKVTLFDPAAAQSGLVRRGLFYTNDNPRQYLPAEIRQQGMELSLSLLSLRRFALDMRYEDFQQRAIDVPILVADGTRVTHSTVKAHPTHDGWYMAAIPAGKSQYAIGLRFGERWEWTQLHSLTGSRRHRLMADGDLEKTLDLVPSVVLEGLDCHPGGLLHSASPEGFLFVPPTNAADGSDVLITVVFRPIADRLPEPAGAEGDGERAAETTAQ